eukprot:517027-Amphidinium_carterae.1
MDHFALFAPFVTHTSGSVYSFDTQPQVLDEGLPAAERLRRIHEYKQKVRMPSLVERLPTFSA